MSTIPVLLFHVYCSACSSAPLTRVQLPGGTLAQDLGCVQQRGPTPRLGLRHPHLPQRERGVADPTQGHLHAAHLHMTWGASWVGLSLL